MVCYASPLKFKSESKAQRGDEMIPWCWNGPFVPLTNRFSASDVSSGEREKTRRGRENLPGKINVPRLPCAHAERLHVRIWKLFLPKSDAFLDPQQQRHSADRKRGRNTLPSFFFPQVIETFSQNTREENIWMCHNEFSQGVCFGFSALFTHMVLSESCWSAAAYKTLMGFWSEAHSLHSVWHIRDVTGDYVKIESFSLF